MNLLTIADGFGDSEAVPDWYPAYVKWPEIIQLMTKGVTLHNLSKFGAGNEYIIHALKQNLLNKDAILIQWAIPNRLDLILDVSSEHKKFWDEQISADPVYNNNLVQVGSDQMWISSGSQAIQEYHKKYISLRQHQLRSQLFIDYATLLLQNTNYGFLLTKSSQYLTQTVHDRSRWLCHDTFHGMCEFRHVSRYAELDLDVAQPIPLIQFDFIRQFIQPKFKLPWRSEREQQAVENMLFKKYQEAIKNRPL
jgi:hypothetical protein